MISGKQVIEQQMKTVKSIEDFDKINFYNRNIEEKETNKNYKIHYVLIINKNDKKVFQAKQDVLNFLKITNREYYLLLQSKKIYEIKRYIDEDFYRGNNEALGNLFSAFDKVKEYSNKESIKNYEERKNLTYNEIEEILNEMKEEIKEIQKDSKGRGINSPKRLVEKTTATIEILHKRSNYIFPAKRIFKKVFKVNTAILERLIEMGEVEIVKNNYNETKNKHSLEYFKVNN